VQEKEEAPLGRDRQEEVQEEEEAALGAQLTR
jgi:hypothetical protein